MGDNVSNLKSKNEQLRLLELQARSLVNIIRTELAQSKGQELEQGAIERIAGYINSPMQDVQINGNQATLHDMLTIYDTAIEELKLIIDNRQYNDSKPLEKGEQETFRKVCELLVQEKASRPEVIDKVYREIIEADKEGELIEQYKRNRIDRVVDREIYQMDTEIREMIDPIESVYEEVRRELIEYKKRDQVAEQVEIFNEEIAQKEQEIQDSGTPAERVQDLNYELEITAMRKLQYISSLDEFSRDGFMDRVEGETTKDYAARLEEELVRLPKQEVEGRLKDKINGLLDREIKVADADNAKIRFLIQDTTVKDRYFPNSSKIGDWDPNELRSFADKLEQDRTYIQGEVDKKRKDRMRLEEDRREYLEELDEKAVVLKTTPYMTKKSGKEPGRFGKWMQRREFLKRNPRTKRKTRKLKGEDKKEFIEKEMLKKKQKRVATFDHSKLLREIEEESKSNPFKIGLIAKVKSNIFKEYDDVMVKEIRKDEERARGGR